MVIVWEPAAHVGVYQEGRVDGRGQVAQMTVRHGPGKKDTVDSWTVRKVRRTVDGRLVGS
jgi:hypothetical protein